jgi:serine O-acetyltransferase
MLKEDVSRVGKGHGDGTWKSTAMICLRELHHHPGFGAVLVYRFGQWAHFECPPIAKLFLIPLYYLLFNAVRCLLQIELPHRATIGGGLRIFHYGGIIVHRDFVAGNNLSLGSGVIIGEHRKKVPRFGSDVFVNPRALIFGNIELGDRVVVGAGSVVTKSFAAGCVIVGAPARLLREETRPRSSGPEPE